MYKLKKNSILFVFALVVLAGAQTFGQESRDARPAEPSYEVLLQVLVASNAASGAQMPTSLAGVVKKLKATFPVADDYRVTATYLNRVENGGNIESKGVIQESSTSPRPVFQDWSLVGVKRVTNAAAATAAVAGNQQLIQVNAFRFGTRVPIQMGENVVYENTGLTINRVNLAENVPTIIGTLQAPKTSELIVLVLTVRPAN